MAKWVQESETLLAHVSTFESYEDQVKARITRRSEDETAEGEELEWLASELSSLIDDMIEFEGTILPDVCARLDMLDEIADVTLREHEEAWEECLLSLSEDPYFEDLELQPQCGLVPLGPDEDSGWWEFWHYESGGRPEFLAEGGWAIQDDTGIVFVLVPGGRATVGYQPSSSALVDDPELMKAWPPSDVQLDPFFLSRYELTQGQYIRVMGGNPSLYGKESMYNDRERPLAHPVERVSWLDAMEVARRYGALLPTEAQWEYAARSGLSGVWAPLEGPEELPAYANLSDRSAREIFAWGRDEDSYEPWNDGWITTAPVGSFDPNPWGLHDMLGNVSELCRDIYLPFRYPTQPGDGLRTLEPGESPKPVENYSARGGDFRRTKLGLRVVERYAYPPTVVAAELGLRLALEIQEARSD